MRVIAVTLCILLAACSDSTGPGSSIAGIYELVSLNGEPLPQEFLGGEILSGNLTLREDGTFTSVVRDRFEDLVTGDTVQETNTESGTYSRDGRSLLFEFDGGDDIAGAYEGGTITLDLGIARLEFERR